MRILSRMLVLLGLVILVAGIYMLFRNWVDIKTLYAVANANRSTPFYNPWNDILIMAALTALGGFITGLGISMPKR